MNFPQDVLNCPGLVLVDFGATWCGPCQMLSPVLDEIGQERPDVKIVKIDVDSEPELQSQYNISSVPTVLIFKDGQLQGTIVGFHQKSEYLAVLK